MAETVFILGAGASHEAGAPVMKNFLDIAEEVAGSPELDIVKKGVDKFARTHSNFPVHPNNLENIFALFEMAEVLEYFPGLKVEEIKQLVPAMHTVIGKTLDETMTYELVNDSKGEWYPNARGAYANFARLVRDIRGKAPHQHDVAVITFNYDVALDWAFADCNQPVSYALGKRAQGIPLLKLHGSLNWAKFKCKEGERIVPWEINNYAYRAPWFPPHSEGGRLINVRMSERIKEYRLKGKEHVAPITAPFVIPPTWNKSGHYGEISSVWAAAALALSDAKNVFVLGYSMPETDVFFKHLLALGTAADTRLERFWVCNPNPDINRKIQDSELLGPGSKGKYRFVDEEFGVAIETIRRQLIKTTL